MHGLTLLLVIILILALVGGGLGWPGTTINQRPYYGVGPVWGGGGLGLVLVIVVILIVLGRL
jgi:hypothetical protein